MASEKGVRKKNEPKPGGAPARLNSPFPETCAFRRGHVKILHRFKALHDVDVEKGLDDYNLQDATKPILPFLDDASNWYGLRKATAKITGITPAAINLIGKILLTPP